ncbi:MAG TPA: hypothetical protein VIC35_00365 [Acidimicrobiia bacterium]|jgi:hypothetical protein
MKLSSAPAERQAADREVAVQTSVNSRSRKWLVACVLVLILAPLVASAVSLATHHSATPIQDDALMEMRVRDVGHHAVLLGLYSRDGWSHPGPLIFYSLALPYRLFGSNTAAMQVGALLINGLAVLAMVAVGRRFAGDRMALAIAVALSALMHALGPNLLSDPWVCYITTLPFGLFLFTVWAMLEGRLWGLPAVAALATWLTQTHVGFAPITAPLAIGGAAVLSFDLWRRHDRKEQQKLIAAYAATALITLVLWLPTLWDQFRGSGNLGAIAGWFTTPNGQTHTLLEGARIVFGTFAYPPNWLTGNRRISPFNGETLLRTETLVPVLLVGFLAALVIAWRRHDSPVVRCGVVISAALAISVVAVSRTIGTMYEYRLLWTWTIAALAAALTIRAFWAPVSKRYPRADRAIAAALVLVLVGLTASQIADVTDAPTQPWDAAVVRDVARQLRKHYSGEHPILLEAPSPDGTSWAQGLLLELEKEGVDARGPAGGAGLYGSSRTIGKKEAPAVRLLVLGPSDFRSLTSHNPPHLVAYAGPGSFARVSASIARHDARAAALDRAFAAGKLSGADFTRRLVATAPKSKALAVVELARAG